MTRSRGKCDVVENQEKRRVQPVQLESLTLFASHQRLPHRCLKLSATCILLVQKPVNTSSQRESSTIDCRTWRGGNGAWESVVCSDSTSYPGLCCVADPAELVVDNRDNLFIPADCSLPGRSSLTLSSPQMSTPQSQQIKQNLLNHPYTQQAHKFVSGQVNALDTEVSRHS